MSTLPQIELNQLERSESPGRRQWIFAALILAGMILILVSFALLVRGLTGSLAGEVCVRL